MKQRFFVLTTLLIVLTGCSTPQIMERGQSAFTYEAIITEKSKAIGVDALIGGEIMSLQLEGTNTRIEVKRGIIGENGYPNTQTTSINERAIITVNKPLNTIDNQIGDKIIALGVVTNIEEVLLGGQKMTLVLLDAKSYKFWNQPDLSIYDYRHRARPGYIANRYASFGFRR